MDEEKLLDSNFVLNQDEPLYDCVDWWEQKRWNYNLIVIGVEIVMMVYFWKGTLAFGIMVSFFWSLAYTFVANIFFSMGWFLEVFMGYYFKHSLIMKSLRGQLYFLGIVFSILLTYILYYNSLSMISSSYYIF